jgi:hypothetical protein
LLRQVPELSPADFAEYPVWIACHVVDYDEPWYDDTDEATVRPWTEPLPVDPSISFLLVRARVVLRDDTEYVGFVTPATGGDLGDSQPHAFVAGRLISFWGGQFGVPEEMRRAFYAGVAKTPSDIFPLRVIASPDLVRGGYGTEVLGFYRMTPGGFAIE